MIKALKHLIENFDLVIILCFKEYNREKKKNIY